MNHFSVRLAVRRPLTIARSTLAAALLIAASGYGGAQLVTPKTVAIHRDDQFAIFPSSYAGMAGGAAALDDTLADPFANPARAAAIRRGRDGIGGGDPGRGRRRARSGLRCQGQRSVGTGIG